MYFDETSVTTMIFISLFGVLFAKWRFFYENIPRIINELTTTKLARMNKELLIFLLHLNQQANGKRLKYGVVKHIYGSILPCCEYR